MLQLSFIKYRPGTYILVEGTPANDKFFIIQSGRVRCYHEAQIPGFAPRILGAGDFVGVVPCMSSHPQDETVEALTEVVVISVRKDQYPELIMKNTPVAMKIVRSFAFTMRTLNENLTKITAKKTASDSPEALFDIAHYYEESGHKDIACYGYYQYLKHCPYGMNSDAAKKRFAAIKPRSSAVYFEPSKDPIRNYPKDTMIFSENQTGADMFIIQEGSVKITKVADNNEVTLAYLRKGDMFGEMALLENKPRSASAIVHEPCRVMTVNRTNFDQMVATQPQMIAKLTTMLAERLWSMERQLANTQLRDAREKMIDMLALQIEKQKVVPVKGEPYRTDFTAMDIANMCGIPPRELSSAIYLLSTDQNVKTVAGKLVVPDLAELIKQAAFYRKQTNKTRR